MNARGRRNAGLNTEWREGCPEVGFARPPGGGAQRSLRGLKPPATFERLPGEAGRASRQAGRASGGEKAAGQSVAPRRQWSDKPQSDLWGCAAVTNVAVPAVGGWGAGGWRA